MTDLVKMNIFRLTMILVKNDQFCLKWWFEVKVIIFDEKTRILSKNDFFVINQRVRQKMIIFRLIDDFG